MKIYASYQEEINLDWFVGKDYWVLVKPESDRFNGTPVYARLIKKDSFVAKGCDYSNPETCRFVDEYFVQFINADLRSYSPAYEINNLLNHLRDNSRGMWVDSEELTLVEPLDFITTEDLAYEITGGNYQ